MNKGKEMIARVGLAKEGGTQTLQSGARQPLISSRFYQAGNKYRLRLEVLTPEQHAMYPETKTSRVKFNPNIGPGKQHKVT